jgi:serine/threonine protein kinase
MSDEPRLASGVERAIRIPESFAAAWREGRRPQIERYLENTAEPDSLWLLPELLRIDLEERERRGERPTAEEYQQRFPAHAALIASAFNARSRQRSGELEAGTVLGDFRIEKWIGAGGMGIVYLARQVSLNRLAALKVLGSALTDQTDIARFRREAQAIAKLNHPGIAGLYFVGQDGHICYIAIEYIDGMSMRELMKALALSVSNHASIDSVLQATSTGEAGPALRFDDPTQTYIPEPSVQGRPVAPNVAAQTVKRLIGTATYIRRCCEIARDAAIALAHAHDRGVIHRDIKPENILLDRQGKPHLIDFGLARFYEDVTLTNTGALVGTPMYMSPEQVTGRLKIDHRTDIYSLGIVLYEMLTLNRPFTSPSREGILRQIVTKAMVPLTWKNKAVPRDLESVIHKSIAKDPDDRYQSAAIFAREIDLLLEGKSISAMPYHYKFDDRSLIAERPGTVVLVAFSQLLFAFMFIVAMIYIYGSRTVLAVSEDQIIRAYTILTILLSTLAYALFLLGRSIMSGYDISRKIMLAEFFLFIIYIIYNVLSTLFYNSAPIDQIASQLGTYFLLLILSSLPVIVLLSHRTKDWFRQATRLRAEHKRQQLAAR